MPPPRIPPVPSSTEIEEEKGGKDSQIAFGMEAFLNDLSQEHSESS